jgi:tryptophan synthase beta chain
MMPVMSDATDSTQSDAPGRFGHFGGRYVSEILMPSLLALEEAVESVVPTAAFQEELDDLLSHYVGRPSPLYRADRLSEFAGGATIWLKREDLNHTGAHKINNCLGQVLLARAMGRTRIIAETGAGQHGVATATVAARFGFPCVVYMGVEDISRQRLNVFRMRLLGAEVIPVTSGSRTLKDAMNEAMRAWVADPTETFYVIGSAAGPHPYPTMVRDFQSVIGHEARLQCAERIGRNPDALVACVGGGSNAIGLFYPFLDEVVDGRPVEIVGIEAAGRGLDSGEHAATLGAGSVGVLHGSKTYVLQDEHGFIQSTHSISAGLDYPGVGPEHAWLKDTGRVTYRSVTDVQALDAFELLCRREGIMPALESSHAIAGAVDLARGMRSDQHVVVCLSGRGDKDTHTVAEALGVEI